MQARSLRSGKIVNFFKSLTNLYVVTTDSNHDTTIKSPYQIFDWHNRGYLPHFNGLTTTQMLTIRLADSLPKHVLINELEKLDKTTSKNKTIDKYRKIERFLDSGYGKCYLKIYTVAQIVEDSLLFFDNKRYQLHAWVVMPNHVHFLLTPYSEYSLSAIVHSFKSYTALKINKLLNRKGKFWFADYHDRYIRNSDHFYDALSYIELNPIKAGLCSNIQKWRFSSAWHKAGAGAQPSRLHAS